VPDLDPASAAALTQPQSDPEPPPIQAAGGTAGPALVGPAGGDPMAVLMAALRAVEPRGAKVAELAAILDREKTWIYERLQDLARQGQVERAGHGRWRISNPHDDQDHEGAR
jgi:hypothetical protein